MAWGCQQANPTGVLGNGGFTYVCSGQDGDSACTGSSGTTNLPGAVAVGAKFQLDYTPKSGSDIQGATGYEVVPASSGLALATSNTILAERSGYVALLARQVGSANVDDFVFMKFATINIVKTASASVTIAPGATSTIQVTAYDVVGAELAGQLACTWSSSDTGTVSVNSTTGLGTITAGCAAGTATVTATCGGGAVAVHVTVSSGGCGGDAGVDASFDAGTDVNPGSDAGTDANTGDDASDGGSNG